MSGMFQAGIRWCLVGLLLAGYVPIPGASSPAVQSREPSRAACCAPKACCTVDHACAGGGACATMGETVAVSHGDTGASAPLLSAASCHPEGARVGSTASFDPIVFASLPARLGGSLVTRSGADEAPGLASRFSSPQVPPPRA